MTQLVATLDVGSLPQAWPWAVFADRRMLVWLIGTSLAWLAFDFVYYGNTIALPIVTKLV